MVPQNDQIGSIVAAPAAYNGKQVSVQGEVTEALSILNFGYFRLKDPTGEILIVPSRTYPRPGERVDVSGKVNNPFVINNQSTLVILEIPSLASNRRP